jgi:hypothetical protein
MGERKRGRVKLGDRGMLRCDNEYLCGQETSGQIRKPAASK